MRSTIAGRGNVGRSGHGLPGGRQLRDERRDGEGGKTEEVTHGRSYAARHDGAGGMRAECALPRFRRRRRRTFWRSARRARLVLRALELGSPNGVRPFSGLEREAGIELERVDEVLSTLR